MRVVDVISTSKQGISPRVLKIIEVCKAIPDDEGWTLKKMCLVLKVSSATVQRYAFDLALQPFRLKRLNRVYWGNAKTIKKEAKG